MNFPRLFGNLRVLAPWAIRAMIFWLLLVRIVPAGPLALLGPRHTVESEKPHVCVHTRLIDEVEEWKIQRSLQLVREMGADHIVEFLPWAYVEGVEGRYDWASVDRIMRHAQNQGIRVIVRTGFVPAWAQGDDETATLNTIAPEAYPAFAAYVGEFVTRYAGVADEIIIWNEPNLSFEWGYQGVDIDGYVELLREVYPVAHAANPDVTIMMAGLAPTLEQSANALDDALYLDAVYAAGGGDYFDAVAMHTYGFNLPADDAPAPDKLNFRRAEVLHDVMAQYDDADKPVYITETGWNDDTAWTFAVRPSLRAIYTVDALRIAEEDWPWLRQMCLWMLRTPAPTNSHQDGFTMITPEFQLKPIYYAVQAYARGTQQEQELWYPPPIE